MARRCSEREPSIRDGLIEFQRVHGALPGLQAAGSLDTLVRQMVASLRRTEYITVLKQQNHSPDRANPHSRLFDPLVAAHLASKAGDKDQAVWLVFLATQFGRHALDRWLLCANVYGSFGRGPIWTEDLYRQNRLGFSEMLQQNAANLRSADVAGRYSNHRQYVSRSPASIQRTFSEMWDWLYDQGSFDQKIRQLHRNVGQNPEAGFDALYRSALKNHSFGRLGVFDLLTMLGKLDLAPIVPGSSYLQGATGPLKGARLLFFGDRDHPISGKTLGDRFDQIDNFVRIGKQPLEDSVCNWQKSPQRFEHFIG